MSVRDQLQTGVLIVGGGPAGLATAIHLGRKIRVHNERISRGEMGGEFIPDGSVLLIEKGASIGAHGVSGAVMDPRGLDELIPDWRSSLPTEGFVSNDDFFYLSQKRAFSMPNPLPDTNNIGKPIISLQRMNGWLEEKAESYGVDIMPGFGGTKLILEDGACKGVVTDDKAYQGGVATELGVCIKSNLTILCEGPRGTLTKEAFSHFNLQKDAEPETYELGVKEIWDLPEDRIKPGHVIHTVGWPLNRKTNGGSFIYAMGDRRLCIGFVTYLSSADPYLDAHRSLQTLKSHPKIRPLLEGGTCTSYAAKAIPGGGFYTIPKLGSRGLLLAGDSAMLCNPQRLKGIHAAIKSGMMAAESAYESLISSSISPEDDYEARFKKSWLYSELYRSRNFYGAMSRGFPFPAVIDFGVQWLTGGESIFEGEMQDRKSDAQKTKTIEDFYGKPQPAPQPLRDEGLSSAKLTDVFRTNTQHDESQPSHLLIGSPDHCSSVCHPTYGSPCTHFCPAAVYEMLPVLSEEDGTHHDNRMMLNVNFSNCIHCKTCDIKCPADNITWTVPQGGDGPSYVLC